jgi:hypothetical protein
MKYLLLIIMAATPALALSSSSDSPNRLERTYNDIGSSIQRQQNNSQQLQQNQFEMNQMRGQIERQRNTPPPPEPVMPPKY